MQKAPVSQLWPHKSAMPFDKSAAQQLILTAARACLTSRAMSGDQARHMCAPDVWVPVQRPRGKGTELVLNWLAAQAVLPSCPQRGKPPVQSSLACAEQAALVLLSTQTALMHRSWPFALGLQHLPAHESMQAQNLRFDTLASHSQLMKIAKAGFEQDTYFMRREPGFACKTTMNLTRVSAHTYSYQQSKEATG